MTEKLTAQELMTDSERAEAIIKDIEELGVIRYDNMHCNDNQGLRVIKCALIYGSDRLFGNNLYSDFYNEEVE